MSASIRVLLLMRDVAVRNLSNPRDVAALTLLATLATAPAAHAQIFDQTSAETIERLVVVRSKEVLAGRATPVERIAQPLVDGLRPQQASAAGINAARRTQGGHPALLVASLGRDNLPISYPLDATPVPDPKAPRADLDNPVDPSKLPSLSGGESGGLIRWVASADCLAAPLQAVLADVAAAFGPLRVNSTCRSKRHNARVGGARRSYHLTGNAVDFRISANAKEVLGFLAKKRSVGGLKHYGMGVFHIDTGPRRTWGNKSWAGAKGWGKKRAGKRRRTA